MRCFRGFILPVLKYYCFAECHEWIRVRNEEVRRRAGMERELASIADQRILRWFGHVERMDVYRVWLERC